MKEQWIQQMRQKMADYSQPAPEVSWSVIDGALPAHTVFPLWIKSVAAAAVVILISGIGLRFLDHGDAVYEQPVNKVIEQEPQPVQEQAEYMEYAEQQAEPAAKTRQTRKVEPTAQMQQPTVEPVHKEIAMVVDEPEVDEPEAETAPQVQEKTTRQADKPTVHETYESPKRKKKSRLMAMAYVSNSFNDSQHFESSNTGITDSDNRNGNPYTTDRNTAPDMEVHHRQPLRFGLSLRYRIDDRWSLEAGLAYTRLISDITTTRNGVSDREIQNLNYIGIPLKVGYEIWSDRKFDVYATTGGVIDRMLDYSFWQFSVNGSLGADYKFTNNLSIYAEEGIGYYFNDGSTLSTIYKDHPLTFNLSFGLRIHF